MYIRTLNVLGFVLASLPGWNLMYIYNAEASRNESRLWYKPLCLLYLIFFSKGNICLCVKTSCISDLENWIDLAWKWMGRNNYVRQRRKEKKGDLHSNRLSCFHVVESCQYRISLLHSQIPLEKQCWVFHPMPPGVMQVWEPFLCWH